MAFAEYEMEPVLAEMPGPDSDSDTLYRTGLKFSLGEDLDLIEAHKWFNLAVAKGHDVARDLRQEMADQMSQDEIRKAQKAAREWLRLMN